MLLRFLQLYAFVAVLVGLDVGFVENQPFWPALVLGVFWPVEVATWLGLVGRPAPEAP